MPEMQRQSQKKDQRRGFVFKGSGFMQRITKKKKKRLNPKKRPRLRQDDKASRAFDEIRSCGEVLAGDSDPWRSPCESGERETRNAARAFGRTARPAQNCRQNKSGNKEMTEQSVYPFAE